MKARSQIKPNQIEIQPKCKPNLAEILRSRAEAQSRGRATAAQPGTPGKQVFRAAPVAHQMPPAPLRGGELLYILLRF